MSNKNQVKALVIETMNQKHFDRLKLIKKMGYSSVNKGLRRLDRFLNCEDLDPIFVGKLTKALDLDADVMNEAIKLDLEIIRAGIEEQERRVFRPYVYLQTLATRPSQICVFAMTGGVRSHKMFLVPEGLPAKTWSEQIKVVKELSEVHHQEKTGIVPFFGKIRGYLYCPTYDSSFEFTLEGETDQIDHGHFCLPQAYVRI